MPYPGSMKVKLKKIMTSVFFSILLGYLLLVVFVYIRQGSMIFFPSKEIEATPRDIGLDFEDMTFSTEDGKKIAAWFVPSGNERGVLLFCHGNAGNISHRLDSIRIFHDLGLSVLIFDYRGYGRSEGSPTEKGTYRDAEAAWNYLINKMKVRPEDVIFFGRSLGAGVAAEMALKHRAAGLIMESAFMSVPSLGSKFFPYLPGHLIRLISRFHYSNIDKINRIGIPKLIIHSPQDEIIPFEHGAALFEKATVPKEFLRIAGGHNEGFMLSGRTYIDGLDRFITRSLASP